MDAADSLGDEAGTPVPAVETVAQAAAESARVEALKSKISSYTTTYNSLDALCWGIPTRVFAANVVLLGILSAHGIEDPVDVGLTAIGLVVLGVTNWLGAKSLHRLWLDHTRNGYWLALAERELAGPDVSEDSAFAKNVRLTFGDDADAVGAVGYFDHRHRSQKETFAAWKASTHSDLRWRRLWPWDRFTSARQRNVIFMNVTSFVFLASAVAMLAALLLGRSEPMRHLDFLTRTPKPEHVIVDRLPTPAVAPPKPPARQPVEPQAASSPTAQRAVAR